MRWERSTATVKSDPSRRKANAWDLCNAEVASLPRCGAASPVDKTHGTLALASQPSRVGSHEYAPGWFDHQETSCQDH
jgi:hypothetical protein